LRDERATSGGETTSGGTRSAAVTDLERRLSEHLGAEVRITTRGMARDRGKVSISFYDLDHFDDLMKKIGLPGGV
jgi:hypothetical protein